MSEEKPVPQPGSGGTPETPAASDLRCRALDRLREVMPDRIGEPHVFMNEVTIPVEPLHLVETCRFLRDDPDCRFELLADLSASDFPERERRLQVVYHLASVRHRTRLRLKTAVSASEVLPSVTGVWPGADWYEREAFDLLGVEFSGHPSLERILMPDDWVGHPLRKDYPLPGFPEQHLRYRIADVTRRSYVDISWKAAGEKAAAIVKKYAGRPPVPEVSPHVPAEPQPTDASPTGGPDSAAR